MESHSQVILKMVYFSSLNPLLLLELLHQVAERVNRALHRGNAFALLRAFCTISSVVVPSPDDISDEGVTEVSIGPLLLFLFLLLVSALIAVH